MKNNRLFIISVCALFISAFVSGQSADEIIKNYVQAIGGKDNINKITSLYTESALDVMGNQGTIKTTVLNGKAMKQEIEVAGTQIVSCYTDKGGWAINPMGGSGSPEDMPAPQYKAGKSEIIVAAPFVDYPENSYKAEFLGTDSVGKINAFKIKMTSPDTISAVYYFDPATFYLVKAVQKAESQGQVMENVSNFSDYKKSDNGFAMPYTVGISMADGQFFLDVKVTKVEFNNSVDPAIFVKPQ